MRVGTSSGIYEVRHGREEADGKTLTKLIHLVGVTWCDKFMHWVRYIGNTSSIIIDEKYLEVFNEKLAIFSGKKETVSK